MKAQILALAIASITMGSAYADEAFKPERLTVKSEVDPGAKVYVLDQGWAGASNVSVLTADNLKVQGAVTPGLQAQMGLNKKTGELLTSSSYLKRIVWGDAEIPVQVWDPKTLTLKKEILSSPKFAMTAASIANFQISDDGHYAFLQNATPAASVSVVDLTTDKAVLEVPTPGCWGIYTSTNSNKFSSLCADGKVSTFILSKDASSYQAYRSDKIFDADSDALFLEGQRDKDTLFFTSFNGNLYKLDNSGNCAVLKDKYSYVDDVDGKWAPGGYQVISYNKPNKLLFVTMHPDAVEGSHKDGATQIWVINTAKKKRVARFDVAEGSDPVNVAVSQTKKPDLFTLSSSGDDGAMVVKYSYDPKTNKAKQEAEQASLGWYDTVMLLDY